LTRSSKISGKAVIAFLAALAVCSVFNIVTITYRTGIQKLHMEQLVEDKSMRISAALTMLLNKTQTVAAFVVQHRDNAADFDQIAYLLADEPAVLNVILAPKGIISAVYPPGGGSEALVGTSLFKNGVAAGAMDASGGVFMDGPFDTPPDGQTLTGTMPVILDGLADDSNIWGYVSVTFRFPEVLDAADLAAFRAQGFDYEICRLDPVSAEKQVIYRNIEHAFYDNRIIEKEMHILNADWFLRVSPVVTWYSHPENVALVLAGILISFLILFLVQNNAELKQMSVYFENMSTTDTLTNVYNRRYLDENIDRLVKSIARSDSVLALMRIDLDSFKIYNDTYGHNKGDSCLKIIAKVLGQTLKRDNDFIVRYSGKEFIAVLPNTDAVGANIMAEKILKNIRDCNISHEKSDIANRVTVSIGVAAGKANYQTLGEDYIKRAGEALEIAKQNGHDRYALLAIGVIA